MHLLPDWFVSDRAGGDIAAIAGSFLSLGFMRDLPPKRAFLAVVSGLMTNHYLGNWAADWLGIRAEYHVDFGFVVGLTAMSIIGGVFALLQNWDADPMSVLVRFIPWLKKNGEADGQRWNHDLRELGSAPDRVLLHRSDSTTRVPVQSRAAEPHTHDIDAGTGVRGRGDGTESRAVTDERPVPLGTGSVRHDKGERDSEEY